MLRINRLIRPTGLIRHAAMYSLLWNKGVLFVIRTGKATNPNMLYDGGPFYKETAEHLQVLHEKKIAETEARINTEDIQTLVKGKGCFQISANELAVFKNEESLVKGGWIQLEWNGGKMKLFFPRAYKKEAEAFVSAVNQDRGVAPTAA